MRFGRQGNHAYHQSPTLAQSISFRATTYFVEKRTRSRGVDCVYVARFCASRLMAAAGPARVEKKTLPRDAATPARQWRKSSAGSLGCLPEGTRAGEIVCWSAGAGMGTGVVARAALRPRLALHASRGSRYPVDSIPTRQSKHPARGDPKSLLDLWSVAGPRSSFALDTAN